MAEDSVLTFVRIIPLARHSREETLVSKNFASCISHCWRYSRFALPPRADPTAKANTALEANLFQGGSMFCSETLPEGCGRHDSRRAWRVTTRRKSAVSN